MEQLHYQYNDSKSSLEQSSNVTQVCEYYFNRRDRFFPRSQGSKGLHIQAIDVVDRDKTIIHETKTTNSLEKILGIKSV